MAANPLPGEDPESPGGRTATRVRVLLVDDEPDIVISMRAVLPALLSEHVTFDIALSGAEAQGKFDSAEYQAVVTDERMPGITGIELLSWVRENHPATARVLMTSYDGAIVQERARTLAGIHLFIQKPFDLGVVVEGLQRVLHPPAVPHP